MGYIRVFRRVRVAPGLTLNLSKHGVSMSAGFRGAHITAGRTGLRKTVGIPGTGVFYTSHQGWVTGVHTGEHFHNTQPAPPSGPRIVNRWPLFAVCLVLGLLGVHRFYAGRASTGALMALASVSCYGLVISVPWWLLDLVVIYAGLFHDGNGNRVT